MFQDWHTDTGYLTENNPDSSTSNIHVCTPVVNSVEMLLS